MKRYKAVLFDLDGTLLDTSEGIFSTLDETAAHLHHAPLTDEERRGFIGPPLPVHMGQVFGLDEAQTAEAVRFFRLVYARRMYRARVYDGIREVLSALRAGGIKTAAATYKKEDMAVSLLHEKGLEFDLIHGADMKGQRTKADIIRMTVEELGVPSEDAVMVGDSENDAIGAEAAGIAFIGVTYGFGFKSSADAEKFPNIGTARTPEEVLTMIGAPRELNGEGK